MTGHEPPEPDPLEPDPLIPDEAHLAALTPIDQDPIGGLTPLTQRGSARGFGASALVQREQEEEEGINWMDMADIFAPVRGIEGFLQGVYQFSDWVLQDSLPDFWDERFLGHSKSLIGGFTEGMVHFLTGFIPVAGVISRGAQFGGATRLLARAGRKFPTRAGAPIRKGSRKLEALARARSGSTISPMGRRIKNHQLGFLERLKYDTAAGAIVDFAVFDAHEKRLSNILREYGGLEDPITEFLAANEGDSELVGRLKMAIEGAGLGLFADSLLHGLGRMRTIRKMRSEGKPVEEIHAVDDAAHREDLMEDAINRERTQSQQAAARQLPPEQRPDDQVFDKVETDAMVSEKVAKKIEKIDADMDKAKEAVIKAKDEPSAAKATSRLAWLRIKREKVVRTEELAQKKLALIPEISHKDLRKVKGEDIYEGEFSDGQRVRIRRDKERRLWIDDETGQVVAQRDESRAIAARRIREHRARNASAHEVLYGDNRLPDVPGGKVSPVFQSLPMDRIHATITEARKQMDASGGEGTIGGGEGINPRPLKEGSEAPGLRLTPDELVERGFKSNGINLARADMSEDALVRAVTKLYEDAMPPELERVAFAQLEERATNMTADMTGNEMPVGILTDKELGLAGKHLETLADTDLKLATKLTARKLAWRHIMIHHAREFYKLSKAAMEAGPDLVERKLAEVAATHARFMAAHRAVTGLKAISGRDLVANKIPFTGYERLMQMLQDGRQMDGLKNLAKQAVEMGDDPVALARILREAERSTNKWQVTMEWWINAVLGGGRTLSINFVSGVMMSIWRPFEKMLGAAMAGNFPGVKDAMLEFTTYVQRFRHAMAFGWESARLNESRLLAGGKLEEFGREAAITPKGIGDAFPKMLPNGVDPNSGFGRIIKHFGRFFRYPSAVLTGTDDAIKYANYHASAESLLRRLATADQGMSPDAAAQWANAKVDDLVYQGQALNEQVLYRKMYDELKADPINKDRSLYEMQNEAIDMASKKWKSTAKHDVLERLVIEEASRVAEHATFTQRIPRGEGATAFEDLTARASDAVAAHPGLRFFATFIKTPFNIMMWARDRSIDPILGMSKRLLSRDLQKALRDGTGAQFAKTNNLKNRYLRDILGAVDLQGLDPSSPAAKALLGAKREEALGRIGGAAAMAMTFTYFVSNGQITGRGPRDKEQRIALQEAGWRPYSFRIGNSYIEYRRLDPFATILGSLADFFTIGKYAPIDDQDELMDAMTAAVVALANNVTNKTYMTGIKNLVELLVDPEADASRILSRFPASFVPSGVAEGVQFLAGDQDEYMREVRSWQDSFFEKSIPYYGQSLDPVRNVLGEPVRRIKSVGTDSIGEIMNLFIPSAYGEVTDDFIREEMAGLNHSFTPPTAVQAGVDLREYTNRKGQSAFDRMMQLRQEVQIGGRTLRRALRERMRSSDYKMMPFRSTIEVQSPRIMEINKVIGRYHRAAVRQMREEFPVVSSAIIQLRRDRANSKAGALSLVR